MCTLDIPLKEYPVKYSESEVGGGPLYCTVSAPLSNKRTRASVSQFVPYTLPNWKRRSCPVLAVEADAHSSIDTAADEPIIPAGNWIYESVLPVKCALPFRKTTPGWTVPAQVGPPTESEALPLLNVYRCTSVAASKEFGRWGSKNKNIWVMLTVSSSSKITAVSLIRKHDIQFWSFRLCMQLLLLLLMFGFD